MRIGCYHVVDFDPYIRVQYSLSVSLIPKESTSHQFLLNLYFVRDWSSVLDNQSNHGGGDCDTTARRQGRDPEAPTLPYTQFPTLNHIQESLVDSIPVSYIRFPDTRLSYIRLRLHPLFDIVNN